ncbi:MAG: ABC transporter ATP-binding protein [Candidatus Poseidoniaceae archaeon]|jgi:putative ABC transport system ATP-binding protein|nr:ABC transporter ATP-binding protein [Candidatus Poseidoniaceae archaeon]
MSGTESNEPTIILEADAVYHVYESKAEDGNVVALRGLNIAMSSGEAVAVVGPSGSGKSTLMKCLGGLMKPSAGSVRLDGRNMTRLTGQELVELRQRTVSFIFQEGNLLNNLNARDNVAQPLINQGVRSRIAKRKAIELLERLQMSHRAMALPKMLSGGEQQRVAIARALITEPRLILADEPTGALDPVTSREVLALFKELHEDDGVSFLIVTHSKEVAAFCDRSLELRDGRFVAEHGKDLNIEQLEVGRELLVDDIGTVTLPPDILVRLGGSGGYTVAEIEPGRLTLVGETIDLGGELVLAGTCPACKHVYENDTEQECPSCGSSRPMVEA